MTRRYNGTNARRDAGTRLKDSHTPMGTLPESPKTEPASDTPPADEVGPVEAQRRRTLKRRLTVEIACSAEPRPVTE